MRRIDTNWLGVAEGFVTLFDHWETATDMWDGVGERQVRHPIQFDGTFASVPVVQLAPTLIDAHSDTYLRLNMRAEEVTETGFMLTVDIWDDTRIARLGVNWQALGPLDDPDEIWDV